MECENIMDNMDLSNKALAAYMKRFPYSFKNEKNFDLLDNADKLKKLCIIDSTELEFLNTQYPELISKILNDISDEILADKKDAKSIYNTVSKKFQRAFDEAKKFSLKIQKEDMYLRDIQNAVSRIKNRVSATLNSDEKKKDYEQQIGEIFSTIRERAKKDESLLNNMSRIMDESKTAEDTSKKFLEEKMLENPTKILFYKSNDRAIAKIEFSDHRQSLSYSAGSGRSIHINRNVKDKDTYTFCVSASILEEILDKNDVRAIDCEISSPFDVYYTYDYGDKTAMSVSLSKQFIENWWNYDCPTLYKMTINTDQSETTLGLVIPIFTTTLVESTFSGVYVDDDITDYEFEKICKGYERTQIYKSVKLALDAQKLRSEKGSEDKIKEMEDFISDYVSNIQRVVDGNITEILKRLSERFKSYVVESDFSKEPPVLKINDNFGLDCGFLFFKTKFNSYNEYCGLTKKSDIIDLHIPYMTQSTTVQRELGHIICDIVNKHFGNDYLYSYTVLD